MDSDLIQISLGVAVAIYLIRTVLEYVLKLTDKIKKKNGGDPQTDTCMHQMIGGVTPQNVSDIFKYLADIKGITNDLHQWHDVRDEDHVFAWYVRKSLSKSIADLTSSVNQLAKGVAQQNELLRKLCE